MLTPAMFRIHRLVLLVTLAIALAATGFSHRMPGTQDEALAFALTNGVPLADICAGDLDGDGQRDPHCLACQIAGSGDLASITPGLIDLELSLHARVIAPRESRALARVVDRAHLPQGPPAA